MRMKSFSIDTPEPSQRKPADIELMAKSQSGSFYYTSGMFTDLFMEPIMLMMNQCSSKSLINWANFLQRSCKFINVHGD